MFVLVLTAQDAFAQTVRHVTNPYLGAFNYLNPDYTAEVQSAAAAQPPARHLPGRWPSWPLIRRQYGWIASRAIYGGRRPVDD